jgi:DNA repair protein RadC
MLPDMSRATYCFTPRPITQREATASAADEVLIADSLDGFAEPLRRRRTKNPIAGASYYGLSPEALNDSKEMMTTESKKRLGKAWKIPADALSLYAGHEGLLVRTAFIRAPGFDSDAPLPRASSPEEVARLLAHLQYADQEHMVVLALNAVHRVTAIYEVAIGTNRGVTLQSRDIVKALLLSGSVAAIIAHNHPSGDPTPSHEDVKMTKSVQQAFACLGYELVDHIIIGRGRQSSFFSMGLLGDEKA